MNFIIDKDKLQNLLRDFYTLTGIRIVVFDNDFSEIACYPNHHSTYCELLRKDKGAKEKCSICDREACIKAERKKSTVIYRCYAGLIEAVTPIKYGDIQVGYIMFGQVLQTDDYEKSWNEILPIVSQFDIDIEALKNAYFKKKNLTVDVISSAASIMQACSGYLHLCKMISLKKDSLEVRLDRYITENLAGELNTGILCKKFQISKTRLYEISEYNYGCSIAEHIRSLRLEKAKKMLGDSDKKISEIAEDCGIPDYNYFTKIFKKYNGGTTPKDYRKRNKKDEV